MGSSLSYLDYPSMFSQKRRHRSVACLTLRDGRSFVLPLCRFIPSSPAAYVQNTKSPKPYVYDTYPIEKEVAPHEFRRAINFPVGRTADLVINVQPLCMNIPENKDANIPMLASRFARAGAARAYLYETDQIGEFERARCHAFVKWAEGMEECNKLAREAYMYETNLRPLQGEAVPVSYGYFRDNERQMACLVLQDCGFEEEGDHDDEFKRQVMLHMCRLHKAGLRIPLAYQKIQRLGVTRLELVNFTHFVMKGTKVRIVGFSDACLHHCLKSWPKVEQGDRVPKSCSDLQELEMRYVSLDFNAKSQLPKSQPPRVPKRDAPWISSSKIVIDSKFLRSYL